MADNVKKFYGSIEKGPTTRLQVQAAEYKDKDYLHVREFYLPDTGERTNNDDWRPTKKGFTFTEGIQIEELIALLMEAQEDF